ncbi:hypothetical protein WME89_34575 [Sorangium sp. So ce321]|uniref:hypothetical protein n=1 Tax=Sorangium sp. So ce321 TaxID=3133300 RepID=UPI003F61100C
MKRQRSFPAVLAVPIVASSWLACSDPPPPTYTPPPECRATTDCALPYNVDPRCGEMACIEGACELELFETSRSQYRGDCEITRCHDGQRVAERDADDVYDDGNPCTEDVCDPTGPVNKYVAPSPAPSGSGFCNGSGQEVTCLYDADCADSTLYCSLLGDCIPLECKNGMLDPDFGETDTDCGGHCDPCRITKPCKNKYDCITGVCGPDGTCSVDRCLDHVQNGNETDVDCGYGCYPCADGYKCRTNENCESGICFAGECQPRTCSDGRRNGEEEDADCGGDCPPCK